MVMREAMTSTGKLYSLRHVFRICINRQSTELTEAWRAAFEEALIDPIKLDGWLCVPAPTSFLPFSLPSTVAVSPSEWTDWRCSTSPLFTICHPPSPQCRSVHSKSRSAQTLNWIAPFIQHRTKESAFIPRFSLTCPTRLIEYVTKVLLELE